MSDLPIRAVVVGASGALGSAVTREWLARNPGSGLMALSRSGDSLDHPRVTAARIDLKSDESIETAIGALPARSIDFAFIASGILHGESFGPEKATRMLNGDTLRHVLQINTVGPALVIRSLLPKLVKEDRAVIAALSARVGSIADNRLGGWHSYRASKAALNMIIKTVSIELARSHKKAIIAGLHPGTVDSPLSEPFQSNVPDGKLFTPERSASAMLDVLERVTPSESGHVFAYDGECLPE